MRQPKTEESPPHIQPGGTLARNAAYVRREADAQLYRWLEEGEYCHVYGPRQIGKSSLALRVCWRLEEEAKVRFALLDFQMLGTSETTLDTWLFSLAHEMLEQLDVQGLDVYAYWREAGGTPVSRWIRLLRDEILRRVEGPVVIVLDEVDVMLRLPFSVVDFLGAIRSLYNGRPNTPDLKRLSFCLVGLAPPDTLIQDAARSPFNIGEVVSLDDLTAPQVRELQRAMPQKADQAGAILDEIFAWTEGHPFMAQRLCQDFLYSKDVDLPVAARVKGAVERTFLRAPFDQPVLQYAHDYVSTHDLGAPLLEMLLLYRRIVEEGQIPYDSKSHAQIHLWRSGMVGKRSDERGEWLRPRNRIFAKVFNNDWLKKREEEHGFGDRLLQWLHAEPSEKKDHLLGGAALKRANERAKTRDMSPQEQAFLRASNEAALKALEAANEQERKDKKLAELKREQEQEAKRHAEEKARISKRNARVLSVLAAVLVLVSIFAFWQKSLADDAALVAGKSAEEAKRAKQRAEEAELREKETALLSRLDLTPWRDSSALLEWIQKASSHGKALQENPPIVVAGLADGLMRYYDTRVVDAHQDWVWSAAFSADGARIITGSKDKTARVWDQKSGNPLFTLNGDRDKPIHDKAIRAAIFSPDGTLAATGGEDAKVVLWDAVTGKLIATLGAHKGFVNALAFSPNAGLLASASDDGTIALWDVKDRKFVKAIEAKKTEINGVSFSPDGKRLAGAGGDTLVRVWSVEDGKELSSLRGHDEQVNKVAFSHDGSRLVSAGEDGKVIVWDVTRASPLSILTERSGNVHQAVFSPDDKRLAVACANGDLKLWNVESGTLLRTLREHKGDIFDVAYAPDGQTLLTAGMDGKIRVWDAPFGRPLAKLQGHVSSVLDIAYSHDNRWIVSGGRDKTARLWRAPSGEPSFVLGGHKGPVRKVLFSPDAKRVITAEEDTDEKDAAKRDAAARIWDTTNGKLITALAGHKGQVAAIAVSSDGKTLATADNAGALRLWTGDGAPLRSLAAHEARVRAVAFSPRGGLLASGDDKGRVMLSSVDGGEPKALRRHNKETGKEEPAHDAEVRALAFSPDGSKLVTASNDQTVRLWDAKTGALLKTLEGHSYNVLAAMFSHDGSKIASAGWDGRAGLWSASEGKSLQWLGHADPLMTAAFSSDDTRFATGSTGGVVQLWDLRSSVAAPLATFVGAGAEIQRVAFSPDGRHLAAASSDGTTFVYAATAQGLLVQACQLLRGRSVFDKVKDACRPFLEERP